MWCRITWISNWVFERQYGCATNQRESTMLWKGIVNQSFSPDEFAQYVNTLSFSTWQPQFVVLHNTAAPTLQQWMSGPTTPQQRILNLEAYYRDQMGWSAGPHLFIDNQLIWAFTPLTTSGVHSPSWNHVSWGIEMVGDYSQESFDQGPGAAVADNAVKASPSGVSRLSRLGGMRDGSVFTAVMRSVHKFSYGHKFERSAATPVVA